MMVQRDKHILSIGGLIGMVVVVAGAAFLVAVAPSWSGWETKPKTARAISDLTSPADLPSRSDMGQARMEILAPVVSAEQQYATYDKIVVEVKNDGTIRVLGERMEMNQFRTLLGDQRAEELQTLVTIRPDDDCLFQHIGRVISVCDDLGIPHQMLTTPTSSASRTEPAKRA